MELICKIKVALPYDFSDEGWNCFWGSVIVATEDKKLIGRSKKAHIFLRSLFGSDTDKNAEIIQRYASVTSLKIEFDNEHKVILSSRKCPFDICISNAPLSKLGEFVSYLQMLLREDSSKLKLPSVSYVSNSMFKLPLSLLNVNGYFEYLMKIKLKKEDLEHVLSLKMHNCISPTSIASGKMKNLRSLWLENNIICNNDVFQVESSELKELHVYECEIEFEIRSLFQNELNYINSLSELYLEHNRWSQVPDGVFQFPNLIKLSLNHNRLTQLPDTFFKLPKLKVLWVAHNQLEYLPCSLTSLQLKDLNAKYNKLVFDTLEPETGSKNVHSLKELTCRTILNNNLVLKEEKLPKSLMESMAHPQRCLCGSKFIDEGQAVAFLFNFQRFSDRFSYFRPNYKAYFPIRGVVCCSLTACLYTSFPTFINSWRHHCKI